MNAPGSLRSDRLPHGDRYVMVADPPADEDHGEGERHLQRSEAHGCG